LWQYFDWISQEATKNVWLASYAKFIILFIRNLKMSKQDQMICRMVSRVVSILFVALTLKMCRKELKYFLIKHHIHTFILSLPKYTDYRSRHMCVAICITIVILFFVYFVSHKKKNSIKINKLIDKCQNLIFNFD
jgi:hypothetical protein